MRFTINPATDTNYNTNINTTDQVGPFIPLAGVCQYVVVPAVVLWPPEIQKMQSQLRIMR